MLIIDINTLQPVDSLSLAEHVILNGSHSLYAEYVVRIY